MNESEGQDVRQKCLWEDIPSFLQFFDSLTVQIHDWLHGNYVKEACYSSSSRYVFWLWKLTFTEVFIIIVISLGWGITRHSLALRIKKTLVTRFNTLDKETDRAAHNVCQLIPRFVIITWTFYEVFIKPKTCTVMTTSSLAWKYLDPDSIPASTGSYVIPFSTWLLYLTAISVYVFHLVAVLFFDEKRRDYTMMVIHHVVTITLITMSYTFQYTEMGLLVLFLHDISDVFLELAKTCHYLTSRADGKKNQLFHKLVDPLVVIFALSWIPTRLYLYPLKGIHELTKVTRETCHFPSIAFSAILLSILLVLNVIWFFMIVRTLVNRVRLGKMTDESSDHPKRIQNNTLLMSNDSAPEKKKVLKEE